METVELLTILFLSLNPINVVSFSASQALNIKNINLKDMNYYAAGPWD